MAPQLLPISRISLSPQFSKQIYTFSEKYSNIPFKVFREKWTEWQKEHQEELQEEIRKIQSTGIQDLPEEIIEKIYTSARFYSKKKNYQKQQKQKQQNPMTKLPPISKKIKKTMEEFIQRKIAETTHSTRPSDLYKEYCKFYIKDIFTEINSLRQTQNQPLDPQALSLKFKKAFHNYLYRKYATKT